MKKLLSIFIAMFIASAMLTSCGGNSIESDAKKVAEIQCKVQKLILKAASGDKSAVEESKKLTAESQDLFKELQEKYKSDSDKQKFGEAVMKEMGNCN